MCGRPRQILEEDILNAARDVFREDGHATTTANIAKRAGVSEGILFYRYKTKVALLTAVIHREVQPVKLLLEIENIAGQRTLKENLAIIIVTLLESVSRVHPFMELAETSPASHKIRQVLFSKGKPPPIQIVELIAGYFEAEMRLGRVRTIDARIAALAAFGACIDYVRSHHEMNDKRDDQAFVQGLVDLLFHGTVKLTSP